MNTGDIPEGVTMQQLLETNRRLNYRNQRLESELGAIRRAAGEWQITGSRTYVPLYTIAAIAEACGIKVPGDRFETHYERIGRLEKALSFVVAQCAQWAERAPADDWGDTPLDTALADAGRYLKGKIDFMLDGAQLPQYRLPQPLQRAKTLNRTDRT